MELKNILVIKMSAIGDVIHALPVSYALKETYPEAKVAWVVEKAAYDILANNPYIDEIILFEKQKFKSLGGLVQNLPSLSRRLRSGEFDASLDLQGLFKSAAMAYLSKAKVRLGFCNMRELSHLVSKPVCGAHAQGHVVERYLDVARALGCRVDKVVFPVYNTPEEINSSQDIALKAGFSLKDRYVVLVPGANWLNKRWPAAHFAGLVDKIYAHGLIPVVVGGPGDKALADTIAAGALKAPVDLTGKTSLKQLAHIIKNAAALVGGDTGPMHLAAGLGVPVVALMGPTDAVRNGPYGEGHIALAVPRGCHGCWKRQCPQGLDCLADISVERVYSALTQIIK